MGTAGGTGVFGCILERRIEVHKACWNVATSQRHDVSASFCLSIIKRKGGLEFEASKWEERGHGNQSSNDLDLKEKLDFCIFLPFG